MASVTWLPHLSTNNHKSMWLLTDGTIVESPDVESTTSERRFRVAGTTATGYKKDIDNLIWQAVIEGAKARNARPWIHLGEARSQTNSANITNEQPLNEARLHFLNESQHGIRYGSTSLTWRFRHPSMPLDAVLTCTMTQNRYQSNKWQIETTLSYPSTDPAHAHSASHVVMNDGALQVNWTGIDRYGQEGGIIEQALAKMSKDLPNLPWGTKALENERDGIKALAKIARLVDDLEYIPIPDLRDRSKPETLKLGLFQTNVTQRFLESLSDYLNSQPVVDQVFESWQEITKLFRSVGIVVGDINKSDLYQLMTHQNKPIQVKIGPVTEEQGDAVINDHSVTFDLATGTIAVVCSGNQHLDEVATNYEAAKIRAQLTGTSDELLAYAEEYARRRAQDKAAEMVANAKKRDQAEPF